MNNFIPTYIFFALCLFVTVITLWFLFKFIQQKMDHFERMILTNQTNPLSETMLQRKLQAYERLALFTERIQFPNVIRRCLPDANNTSSLIQNMKMDIQLEYEHNITQQLYVSNKLWEIISIAKDDAIQTLDELNQDLETYQSEQVFIHALMDKLGQRTFNPLDTATAAIRTEVAHLI
ncbi:DUF7935 family protein [Membranihabitans marinus]|uniref:DUF7935 family protein n=1 Tax=Membranihabitans marinus TaxID=1227546 RepID=UPI001F2FFFE7|nr:hypothetical protein [Membranihabitans marinus]